MHAWLTLCAYDSWYSQITLWQDNHRSFFSSISGLKYWQLQPMIRTWLTQTSFTISWRTSWATFGASATNVARVTYYIIIRTNNNYPRSNNHVHMRIVQRSMWMLSNNSIWREPSNFELKLSTSLLSWTCSQW